MCRDGKRHLVVLAEFAVILVFPRLSNPRCSHVATLGIHNLAFGQFAHLPPPLVKQRGSTQPCKPQCSDYDRMNAQVLPRCEAEPDEILLFLECSGTKAHQALQLGQCLVDLWDSPRAVDELAAVAMKLP